MIFQEPMSSLNPVFRVGKQIGEVVKIHGNFSASEVKEKVIDVMQKVGIPAPESRYYDYPFQLSGGLRQRIMIAMSLIQKPSLLIADEPTTALDVTIQAQILRLIQGLQESSKMSVLMITHDLGVVAEVAHRVAVMYAGLIVEIAKVEELFDRPLHPYTQALRKAIPRPEQESSEALATIPGRVPGLGKTPPYCFYYDRCEIAEESCKQGVPPLKETEENHWVRCFKV